MRGVVIYEDVAGDNKVEVGTVMRGCGCQEEEDVAGKLRKSNEGMASKEQLMRGVTGKERSS